LEFGSEGRRGAAEFGIRNLELVEFAGIRMAGFASISDSNSQFQIPNSERSKFPIPNAARRARRYSVARLAGARSFVTRLNRAPESLPLPEILQEDDTLLAFDKPAGVAVSKDQQSKGREALMDRVRARFGDDVANVHRLDPEASGVLLCAKTKIALDYLSGQFQSKTADKRFLALVTVLPAERAMPVAAALRAADGGLADAFTIDLPLVDDRREPGQMRVGKGQGARECLTEFKVLERFGRFAWLECQPVTGRTHQLRVHLAAAGAPVLNDRLYGDLTLKLLLSDLKRGYKGREEEKPLIARLALHASELTFKHPTTKEPVTVRAPLPLEMEIALKYLRKFSPSRGSKSFKR
jgi:23S rRNA pseudouridine1911/1915/1917 synthase